MRLRDLTLEERKNRVWWRNLYRHNKKVLLSVKCPKLEKELSKRRIMKLNEKWEGVNRLVLRYFAVEVVVELCAAKLQYHYCFTNGSISEEVFFETFEEAKAAGIERFKKEFVEVLAELDDYKERI